MSDYSEAPRKAVNDYLANVDFDTIVVITADRHTNTAQNWWHVSGHPDDWDGDQLTHIAYRLVSTAAEYMKADANNPLERAYTVETKKIVFTKNPVNAYGITLFCVGLALKNPRNRLFLWIDLKFREVGLHLTFYENINTKTGIPYWGVELLLGVIAF